MNIQTKQVYSEVYSVLSLLGENYVSKLPLRLYRMISDERLEEYNPQYTMEVALDKQKIQKDSIAMIALFQMNYWCKNNIEKEKLKKIFQENEEKYRLEEEKKYSTDNLFKRDRLNKEENESGTVESDTVKQEKQMIEYKDSIFKKIINKIKRFLKFGNK